MKILNLAFCLFLTFTVQCQWMEQFRIPVQADQIAMDNLLNVYHVRKSELYKHDSQGAFKFRFSDKQLGEIGQIDVTYPMRPLVTYPALNYMVILDNTLSDKRGKVNLLNLNIELGTLACASIQNHFWFYDAMNFSLIRSNETLKKTFETGNLAQILGIDLQPNYMVEFANRLYINNPSTGILIFDIFGSYIKTIPLTGLEKFQVFENHIVYFQDKALFRYNMMMYDSEKIELPIEALDAVLQKNRVALMLEKEIVVFDHTIP